jgi:hypothetical protein
LQIVARPKVNPAWASQPLEQPKRSVAVLCASGGRKKDHFTHQETVKIFSGAWTNCKSAVSVCLFGEGKSIIPSRDTETVSRKSAGAPLSGASALDGQVMTQTGS